jgi:ribosomal-protein-alanine N-acetyltransferase
MNVSIRKMTADDVLAVALIDSMSMALPWSPRTYANEVSVSHSRCYVAETVPDAPLEFVAPPNVLVESFTCPAGEPAVVGMLVMWLILDEAHIATVAVHPQVRRAGIGRLLMETALHDAAAEGMKSSLLEVRAGNLAAQTLYRDLGFEEVGRRPRYYKDNGEDAVLMTLSPLESNVA